ncbi:hypothetical protein KAI32_01635 [Candidatus Pacearchaeota archaeon]|nr:hypothetical protein [Candidatus Pacearchaeota archaeon]
MEKRGLSPVIASVFLILLVIVLSSLIFSWSRGFMNEQIEKFGQPVGELCNSVDFEVNRIEGTGNNDILEVVNRGNININSLEIKIYKNGSSETQNFDFVIHSMKSISKEVPLRMEDGSFPEKIEIFPVLIGNVKGKHSNKVFTCLDASKTIFLDS